MCDFPRYSLKVFSCRCGGFRLRAGLSVALRLALFLLLVWVGLFLFLPKSQPFAKFILAQIDTTPSDSENTAKRTWNSKTWDLYQGNGRFRTEFHSKWIHYLDADDKWKDINPTLSESPFTDPDYYVASALPFKVKIPKNSLGTASFESNNRYDIFDDKKIDDPPLTQTIEALEIQNVSGVLENYEANNQGGSGGPLNSVRYPLAYPQYNADLIYYVQHGRAPRLQKLIKFTLNPYVQEDVRLRFKMAFDAPVEMEAEEDTASLLAGLQGDGSRSPSESLASSSTVLVIPADAGIQASSTPESSSSTAPVISNPEGVRNPPPESRGSLASARDDQKEKPQRQKWSKQAKLKTKKKIGVRIEGSTSRRGIGFKNFFVWDSAQPSNRQPIQVELDPQPDGSIILTKVIPKEYLETATYPVFTDTTSTFFPDADPETTSVDGVVNSQQSCTSLATKRTEAGGSALDASDNTLVVELSSSGCSNSNFIKMGRGIFLFDTSSIPDGNTVDSATFSLIGTLKQNSFSLSIGVTTSSPASNTALVASDYNIANFGSTDLATRITVASFSADSATYNDFALNSTGLNIISKTGVSKFGVRTSADIDNSAPAWLNADDIVYVDYAEYTGTLADPKLVVVHSVGAAASAFFLLFD